MSVFRDLVEEFDQLAEQIDEAKGNDKRALKREVDKVKKDLADLVAPAVYDYNVSYAECRDVGHKWDEHFAEWEGNSLTRQLHCGGCGSTRLDVFTRFGALVFRKYNYAEGYLLSEHDDLNLEHSRRLWRAANIERVRNLTI